jgi:DNA-binding winged helix-turn-helix (wHTH) protein
MTEPRTCEFGDVYVDFSRMTVKRDGTVVGIEPKVFDLLRFLITHRDRLVTKEELLDGVWRDTFVAPNALTRAVAQLRKALGDDADEPRYIETAARRGYRFIAPVIVDAGGAGVEVPAAPAAAPPRRRPSAVALAAAAALGVVVVGLVVWVAGRAMLRNGHGPTGGLTPSRVTASGGINVEPALSPGPRNLQTMLGAGNVQFSRDDRALFFSGLGANLSPDGHRIAFERGIRRGNVWTVQVE